MRKRHYTGKFIRSTTIFGCADLFEKVLSGTAGVSFDQNNTNQSSDNMTPELVPSSGCNMSSSQGSMTNSESLDVESSASLSGKKRRRTSSSDLKSQ